MAEGESTDSTGNTISPARYMDVSAKRMSKRMQEPTEVDRWLLEKGYFRKDSPRDPTCLFRAVSEQVYHTQYYHIKVRKECILFMKKMRHLFEEFISIPFDHYLEQMTCFTEWGGMNEIRAMSLLYKRDVIIFNGQKQTVENVTNGGFDDNLLLCYTPPKQYETVHTVAYINNAAFCQSVAYEILYKNVFNMSGITDTAHRMLHDRNATFRHDRFFQKGNLEIREQLTADLYSKVENERNCADEVQSDFRGTPPIPYKVAKALSPDIYRNTDFDTWHEIKREVKYGGWNRHNSNELQVGGKCLINYNSLVNQDQLNNNLSKSDVNGSNIKPVQQKPKQEGTSYTGYIQEMGMNEEPVLVFIEELGEKRYVPYTVLKPFPSAKKNKQNNLTPHNRKNALTDTGRRWRKMYNSTSRKRKDTMNVANDVTNNTSRNGIDNSNINGIDKADFKTDGQNAESSKMDKHQTTEIQNAAKNCSNYATSEISNNLPEIFDNSQSVKINNITAQEVSDDRKKANTVFTKHTVDNGSLNKPGRSGASNTYDNNYQNSYSKAKILDENYCQPHVVNPHVNAVANPDLFYFFADGSSCPVIPFLSRNFGEFDQTEHIIPPRYAYNSGLECFRVNQAWSYGPVAFGPGHGAQSIEGVPPNANINGAPYMQEEVTHLVNGMQNCSLSYNEVAGCNGDRRDANVGPIVYKTSFPYINNVQNTKHLKQGSKNLGSKDFSYQHPDKKHNSINNKNNKGNKTRQQNTRETASQAQYWGQYSTVMPAAPNDPRFIAQIQQQQLHHFDTTMQSQTATNPVNACAPYTPPPNTVLFYPNDATTADAYCNSYYMNGGFVPVTCLPPPPISAHDVSENTPVTPPYPQHMFPHHTETYPPAASYQPTMCHPMMYQPAPPQMQFPPVLQHQQPLPPNIQEQHWYPMVGPSSSHYVQYATPATPVITETSCNGQATGGDGTNVVDVRPLAELRVCLLPSTSPDLFIPCNRVKSRSTEWNIIYKRHETTFFRELNLHQTTKHIL